jgi:hypothetical protein
MGAKSEKVTLIAWAVATCLALAWSTADSLTVLWAASRHAKVSKSIFDSSGSAILEFKREEQKYFLKYGVYVPLEDMMFVSQIPMSGERYSDALNRACSGLESSHGNASGNAKGFAIWLPLKTRWPLIGERVSEWCWKPQIQK